MTYLITFACDGCHLHGNESGSIDRDRNLFGGRVAEPNPERLAVVQELMDQPPYQMDPPRRSAVLEAIHEVCSHRGWKLWLFDSAQVSAAIAYVIEEQGDAMAVFLSER